MIQISGRRKDSQAVQVLKSPAGEGWSPFKLALSLGQIDGLLAHRGVDLRATGSGTRARLAAQQVGDQLFRSLFSGQVKSLYDQSLGTLSSRTGCGLRIKLKFDAQDQELARLASIPWEFLWRGETHDFLSLSRLSPVVRYLDVPRPAAPIPLESVLRVLVVISSPLGLQPLDVQQERAHLEAAFQGWTGVEITVLVSVDSASIRRRLLERPFHVLHFIGHGGFDPEQGEGVLFLERPDGHPEPVTGQFLATFLKDIETLGLVFLNARDTAHADSNGVNPFSGVAGALVLGGLPAVVAMQFPISDRAAIAFSKAFYQRLAIGDPVDASVVEGRQAILAAVPGTHEWGTPVLFLRVPDGTVFQPPASAGKGPGGWRRALMAFLLTALLVTLCMLAFETLADRFAGRHVLEIDQEFGSSVSGLSGVLATAELRPNGRMRLHFHFRNTSARQVGVGFDYRSTYLADGAGNEYRVLATDATAESAVDSIPPGGEIERWLEFPAPLDRARKFHVALAGRGSTKARFPFFTIALPRYPPELSRSMPAMKSAPDALALAVNRSVASSIAGIKGELRGVELRADGRMRWSIDFFNGSDRDQPIGFDYSAIYLVDEQGNRYGVLGSDTGGQPGQVFRDRLPRAVRRGYWFDFPAPRNGARSFTLVFASSDITIPRFILFDVRVPFYPPQPSIRERPSASIPPPVRTETISAPKEALALPVRIETISVSREAPAFIPLSSPQKTAAYEPPPAEVQGREKEFIPIVRDDAWRAYIHDDEGRDRALLLPVERNSDKDWMFLRFTDYEGPRDRLAILRVENKSINPNSEDDRGGRVEVPLQQIEDLFSTSLFNTNRFTLIERKRIQTAIAEQDFGSPERINPESAVKIGKLLGADYLVVVAVNEWTPKKSGFGAVGSGQSTAEVALSFRVIDAASGELTFSGTERITAGSWNVAGHKEAPIAYSLQACLNKGAYRLANSLKVQPWRGAVVEIKGTNVYINAGRNRGIAAGMKLTALSKGEVVIDSETHLPLGNDTEAIGTLMVTTVNETFSIAAISQGCKGLKKGDQVEIVAEKF